MIAGIHRRARVSRCRARRRSSRRCSTTGCSGKAAPGVVRHYRVHHHRDPGQRAPRANPTRPISRSNRQFNTYRSRGLPPAPIANPGLTALQAALFPCGNRLLVLRGASDPDTGSHHFSSVLSAALRGQVRLPEGGRSVRTSSCAFLKPQISQMLGRPSGHCRRWSASTRRCASAAVASGDCARFTLGKDPVVHRVCRGQVRVLLLRLRQGGRA